NDLKSALDKLPSGWSMSEVGGYNPVTYEWKDSRGNHAVIAEVDKFKIPRLIRKKSGGWWRNKKCIILIHHTQNVTVTVTRKDPAGKAVGTGGLLGKWNPYYGGVIKRKSVAKFRGLAARLGYIKLVGK
ncbi:MAG: hypothetical protein N2Z79_00365, partial [Candidatus Omnitrophica bacterium]|nr:hypothetical protein [Candidatus Omnitrophota bacterium]